MDRDVRRSSNGIGGRSYETVDVARPVTDESIYGQLDTMREHIKGILKEYRYDPDNVKPTTSGLARVSLMPQVSARYSRALYPALSFNEVKQLLSETVESIPTASGAAQGVTGASIEVNRGRLDREMPTLVSVYCADKQLIDEKMAVMDALTPWASDPEYQSPSLTPRLKICRLPEIDEWVADEIQDRLEDQLTSLAINLGALAVNTRTFLVEPVS